MSIFLNFSFFIKDSLIQLDVLLQSPIISLIRPKVESLITKINQVLSISEAWFQTQNKVRFLKLVLLLFSNFSIS